MERDVDAVCALDAEGRIALVNSAAARLFGRRREQLVGSLLGVPLSRGNGAELHIPREGTEAATVELVLLGEEGGRRWIKLRDITALAQVRNQLDQARIRYELIESAANDGLWHWDLASDRAHFSLRWREILGLAERELDDSVGEWLERVHPEDKATCAGRAAHAPRGTVRAFRERAPPDARERRLALGAVAAGSPSATTRTRPRTSPARSATSPAASSPRTSSRTAPSTTR